jgi:hypothetical protein
MYIKDIVINISDIDPNLTGELKFRQPKASEIGEMQDEEQRVADLNVERVSKGLKPLQLRSQGIALMEKLILNCYLEGKDGDTPISKEEFERAFTNMNSVIYIFYKINDIKTEGLENEKIKSGEISEAEK